MQKKTYNPGKITKATQNDISYVTIPVVAKMIIRWKMSFFYDELTNEFSNMFIYRETNNEPAAGFIVVRKVTNTIEILKIAVKKKFRKKGIGSEMMNFIMSGQFAEGVNIFSLEVRASNEEAIKFYRSFKFERSGFRKNYYKDPPEDAMILQLRKD